jgi:hypothetical protein
MYLSIYSCVLRMTPDEVCVLVSLSGLKKRATNESQVKRGRKRRAAIPPVPARHADSAACFISSLVRKICDCSLFTVPKVYCNSETSLPWFTGREGFRRDMIIEKLSCGSEPHHAQVVINEDFSSHDDLFPGVLGP